MTYKEFTSGLFLLLFVFSIRPDASAQTPKKSDPCRSVVPFHLIARQVMVEAEIEGKQGLLIIDTGSKELILNAAYFQRRRGNTTIRDLGGHSVKVKTGYFSFSMGSIKIKNKRAYLADLRHLEHNRNIDILGVVGYRILKDYEVMLDYAAKKLTFFHLDKRGNRLSPLAADSEPTHILPLELRNHLPCLEVMVGTEPFVIALDTGAGINVMDAEARERAPVRYPNGREVNVKSFGKQSTRSAVALIEGAQIADMVLPGMRTLFKSLEPLNEHITGRKVDGLFGFEFLYHYKTAFNFRKGEFSIWNGYAGERVITTNEVDE